MRLSNIRIFIQIIFLCQLTVFSFCLRTSLASGIDNENCIVDALSTEEKNSKYSFKNSDFRNQVLDAVRLGSLGLIENAFREVEKKYPDQNINSNQIRLGFFDFETDILHLLEIAPELRSGFNNKFKEKYYLNDQELLDLLTYYGGRHFFNRVEIAGNPRDVFKRLSELKRDQFLKSNHPSAQRFEFYQDSVTKLSVPEMASALGINEGQVYRDLSILGISIVEEFRKQNPEILVKGYNDSDLNQAQKFIRHHLHLEPRAVSWNELVLKDPHNALTQTELLVELFDLGYSRVQIAKELNRLSKTEDPSNIHFRTEASVNTKLMELGLTNQNNISDLDVILPQYGFVKKDGRIVTQNALDYIFDHYDFEIKELADTLGVTESGLRDFLFRHHVTLDIGEKRVSREKGKNNKEKINKETEELIDIYKEQKRVLKLTIDWMKKHKSQPKSTDFRSNIDKGNVGILYSKIAGENLDKKKIFPSVYEFWSAVEFEAKKEGLPFRWLSIKWQQDIPVELREKWQTEAIDEVLSWMKRNNFKTPRNIDFAPRSGAQYIQIHPDRFFRAGDYKKPENDNYIFPNPITAWRAIAKRAKEENIPFNWLSVEMQDDLPEDIKDRLKIEVLELIKKWLHKNEFKMLSVEDFSAKPDAEENNKIPLNYPRVFRVGSYKTIYFRSIFSSTIEAWKAIEELYRSEKKPFYWVKLVWRSEVPDDLREVWRKETLELIIDWMKVNKRIPTVKDFNTEIINYHKCFSLADYAGTSNRVFDSLGDGWLNIKIALETTIDIDSKLKDKLLRDIKKKIEFSTKEKKSNLIQLKTEAEITEDLRQEWRNQVTEAFIEWMKVHGRRPTVKEINNELINYSKCFASGPYKITSNRFRVFDSPKDGWAAISDALEKDQTIDSVLKSKLLEQITKDCNSSEDACE